MYCTVRPCTVRPCLGSVAVPVVNGYGDFPGGWRPQSCPVQPMALRRAVAGSFQPYRVHWSAVRLMLVWTAGMVSGRADWTQAGQTDDR